jgi:hypothetical protein
MAMVESGGAAGAAGVQLACQLNVFRFEGTPPLVVTFRAKHALGGIAKLDRENTHPLLPTPILQKAGESVYVKSIQD